MGDTRRHTLAVISAVLAALGFAAPASASFTSLAPAAPNVAPAATVSLTASVETTTSSLGTGLSWSWTPTGPRPYFGTRYYASKIGRFTTVDPAYNWPDNLVDPQRWNRYSYGRNNPFRYVDPDGRVIFDFQEFRANLQLATQFGENKAGYLVPSLAVVAVVGSIAGDLSLATSGFKLVQGIRAGLAAGAEESLAARVKDIHGLVRQATQDKTTIAAARAVTSEGTERVFIASSEKALRPVQAAALRAGEQAAEGAGHAEVTAINAAKAAGARVTEVAASRPICPGCAAAIRKTGAKIASPLKDIP